MPTSSALRSVRVEPALALSPGSNVEVENLLRGEGANDNQAVDPSYLFQVVAIHQSEVFGDVCGFALDVLC